MDCQDILINRYLDLIQVSLKISQIFSIEPSEILVVEEIPEYPVSKSIRILCQTQKLDGDFKQMISIYFRDKSLSSFLTYQAIGNFCEFFKCTCLISDDDNNPYSMILIKGVDSYHKVYLSPELLEEEKYVLAG